jgi:1-pyrroline-5-carboxylate dehydrogenase
MEHILKKTPVNQTLFTGSSTIGEHLAKTLKGKIRLEDAGFDWKILGPDVPKDQNMIDYVAWQSDQDAYAHSGQKCSA